MQAYFACGEYIPLGYAKLPLQKNTQAYFACGEYIPLGYAKLLLQKNTPAYRSGHNEAVLKTVCRKARGFESLSLRQ